MYVNVIKKNASLENSLKKQSIFVISQFHRYTQREFTCIYVLFNFIYTVLRLKCCMHGHV